jgi:hypothetical protein
VPVIENQSPSDSPGLFTSNILDVALDISEPMLRLLFSGRSSNDLVERGSTGWITAFYPQHLHICQYFSALWLEPDLLNENRRDLEKDTQVLRRRTESFYLIRSKEQNDEETLRVLNQISPVIFDGWEVVWICHRELFPYFLSNSLRALEIMCRKYGVRSVA